MNLEMCLSLMFMCVVLPLFAWVALFTCCSHGVRAPIPQTSGVLIEEDAPSKNGLFDNTLNMHMFTMPVIKHSLYMYVNVV